MLVCFKVFHQILLQDSKILQRLKNYSLKNPYKNCLTEEQSDVAMKLFRFSKSSFQIKINALQ